jgi:hypothetical protein
VEGAAAMDRLVEAAADHNFVINIYEISPDRIYFWASLTEAEEIHRDLSTEFTDLEGLIKKMGSEKLTGFIDVSIDKGNETALVFFNNGEIIGGTYSWEKQGLNPSKDSLELLVQKTKDSGGIFNVSKISSTSGIVDEKKEGPKEEPQADTSTMLEGLLVIFERLTHSNKRIKSDFNTLLKRKLVEKADKYIFLDPFAGEFEYSDQRISFSGGTSEMELANGIIEAVVELAEELDILPQLKEELAPWFKKYERDLSNFGISF